MDGVKFVSDYSVNLQCQFMVDKQYTITRIPLFAEVRSKEGYTVGYRQMTDDEVDSNIILSDGEGNYISLLDFKKKYILSLE
jgi:hypothetical protein